MLVLVRIVAAVFCTMFDQALREACEQRITVIKTTENKQSFTVVRQEQQCDLANVGVVKGHFSGISKVYSHFFALSANTDINFFLDFTSSVCCTKQIRNMGFLVLVYKQLISVYFLSHTTGFHFFTCHHVNQFLERPTCRLAVLMLNINSTKLSVALLRQLRGGSMVVLLLLMAVHQIHSYFPILLEVIRCSIKVCLFQSTVSMIKYHDANVPVEVAELLFVVFSFFPCRFSLLNQVL